MQDYELSAWLGGTETTHAQRELLHVAADLVATRYPDRDVDDDREIAFSAAAMLILGYQTLEDIAAEYQAARRVERACMTALTGAIIAASATRSESDIARAAGVQRLTVRKALCK